MSKQCPHPTGAPGWCNLRSPSGPVRSVSRPLAAVRQLGVWLALHQQTTADRPPTDWPTPIRTGARGQPASRRVSRSRRNGDSARAGRSPSKPHRSSSHAVPRSPAAARRVGQPPSPATHRVRPAIRWGPGLRAPLAQTRTISGRPAGGPGGRSNRPTFPCAAGGCGCLAEMARRERGWPFRDDGQKTAPQPKDVAAAVRSLRWPHAL